MRGLTAAATAMETSCSSSMSQSLNISTLGTSGKNFNRASAAAVTVPQLGCRGGIVSRIVALDSSLRVDGRYDHGGLHTLSTRSLARGRCWGPVDSKWVGASRFLLATGRSLKNKNNDRGERSCCRAKNDFFGNREPEEEEAIIQKPGWPVLERWDIPWDGKTTSLGMLAWLLSFLLTGLVVSVVAAQFGIGRRQYMSLDDQAVYILIHQLAQTIAGLSIINVAVDKYKPLPEGLFKFELNSPFNLERGWLLWGGLGIICSGAAVVAASYISAAINGHPPSRDDTDALVQLLPIIGASPLSTASLIGVTGVLAPLLEETVFRGFLMTSLTKWVPTPLAVVISAIAFAGAHLTPGEFPQLFSLGIILGFSYAQTRNLACPMLIHCIWNSGVVIILTLLRLQGYDIQELL